jgi:hypothetical protein
MKLIKNILIICLLTNLAALKALPKQGILLLIRDQQTGKVVYDTPLQLFYGGFFTSSNYNGEIILPRKTQALDFYILITNKITPIFNILNNISHLQITDNHHAVMYHITTQTNPLTNKLEWLTTIADFSQDKQVPLHTIIIFNDPSNVSMKTGQASMQIDNHVILPSLYLNLPLVNNDLALLIPNIRPFLAKLDTAYALTPYGYATIQTR